jgi:hypothetical protein
MYLQIASYSVARRTQNLDFLHMSVLSLLESSTRRKSQNRLTAGLEALARHVDLYQKIVT